MDKKEIIKKKNILIIPIILVLVILLLPIPTKLKDGGSIEFKALLYSITKYHKLTPVGHYIDGIGIKILGMEIYDSTDNGIGSNALFSYNIE